MIDIEDIIYNTEEQNEIELELSDYTYLRYNYEQDLFYYYAIQGEEEVQIDLPLSVFESTKHSEVFTLDSKKITILVEDLKLIKSLKELHDGTRESEKVNTNKG